MSKSLYETQVRLEIRAPEQTTEIFVVDSHFRRVASGLGELSTQVPPGIYKVRFRSGNKQRDQLIEATPGQTVVQVTTSPLGFASAAPIGKTSTSREDHRRPATTHSHQTHLQIGRGSQLYTFSRDLTDQPADPPWTGVSLRQLDGNLIADLEAGACDRSRRFAALNVELDPGTYRLRVDTGPLGCYEMFVVACAGWQTQTFLSSTDFQAGEVSLRRAALKTAAVLMARIGVGFQPYAEEARLAELARQGLASGRNVVRGSDLNALLGGKFENPMLGIYGAHLLARSRRPDHSLFDTVVGNLEELLGYHPDVSVLALRSGGPTSREPIAFSTPPMLRASWEMIVKASLRRASIVPPGSVTEHLAEGLMSTTPWLLHRVPEAEPAEVETVSYAQARRTLERLVRFGQGDGREQMEQMQRDRSAVAPLEQRIIQSALGAARLTEMPTSEISRDYLPRILRELQAPAGTIARSTASLATKLGLTEDAK